MEINISIPGPIKNHEVAYTSYKNNYMSVQMTPREALNLIVSLSNQLAANDSNTGRIETYSDEGDFKGYFSISVGPESVCLQCGHRFNAMKDGILGKVVQAGMICSTHKTFRELEEGE